MVDCMLPPATCIAIYIIYAFSFRAKFHLFTLVLRAPSQPASQLASSSYLRGKMTQERPCLTLDTWLACCEQMATTAPATITAPASSASRVISTPRWRSVRKTHLFLEPFLYPKRSFYQDKLGGHLGKVEGKGALGRIRLDQAGWMRPGGRRGIVVRRDAFYELNFIDLKTITLPRQAQDKDKEKLRGQGVSVSCRSEMFNHSIRLLGKKKIFSPTSQHYVYMMI